MKRFERLFVSRWGLLVIYIVFLGAYLGASGGRLRQHSQYNHFVYLAEGWLKGRLDMPSDAPLRRPPHLGRLPDFRDPRRVVEAMDSRNRNPRSRPRRRATVKPGRVGRRGLPRPPAFEDLDEREWADLVRIVEANRRRTAQQKR